MSTLDTSVRLVVVLPALAALAGTTVPRQNRGAAALLGVGGTVLALVAAVAELLATSGASAAGISLLGPVPTGAGLVSLDLRADQLSAVVAVMVTVVALCVQVFSTAYQAGDPRYRAYAATVSLFTAAMLLVVQADDLLLLLVGWEVMGLCSYLLIGHESEREAARRAAVKAFLVTRVGDVGFVLGIIVLLVAAGTTSITTLLQPATLQSLGTPTLTAATLLLVAGVVGKSAQFPLHTWLPDAMEGPTPISALIHAATMVAAGGYVLARLLPLLVAAPAGRATLAVLTAVTMLGAALVACVQSDLKRVLAWSTISQVAYLLAALAVSPPELGPAPSTLHLLSHAGFKGLLFLAAGALAHQVHSTSMTDLAGAGRRAPVVAITFSLGLGALAGLPPLSGFWSKEAVLGAAEMAATEGGPYAWAAWLVLVSGVVTGLVTAAYCARTWLLVVPQPAGARPATAAADPFRPSDRSPGAESGLTGGKGPDDGELAASRLDPQIAADADIRTEAEHQLERPLPDPVPAAMQGPLLLLAVPTVFGGLLLLGPAVPGHVHVSVAASVLPALLAVAGVAGAWLAARGGEDPARLLPLRLRTVLLAGFGVDAVQHALVVRPVRALARVVASGDRDVVDAYVRAMAWGTRWAGRGLRRTQTGSATGYLTWLVAGALVLAVSVVGTGGR